MTDDPMDLYGISAPDDASCELSISLCDERASGQWDAFVHSTPGASLYHLWDWRKINRECLGHESFYLTASRASGDLLGLLPLTLVRSRLFGRILCSMPFVNFGGPCAVNDATELALVERAIAHANELDVDYMELRCTRPLNTALPESLRKISLTIDLQPDPDALWNAFTSKHRKNVRRSYKHGLEVRSGGGEFLPQFYSLMEESWRNLGTPFYSRSYFSRILATFHERIRLFVCYQGEHAVAAAMTGYFGDVVEGMWAGGNEAARQLDANYVLYWEMIRDACVRGFRQFHLGRSTAGAGGEDFKRRWNAKAQQLYWYYHMPRGGALPALNVDNPKYELAIKLWRRLPIWTTRVFGPPLARLIP